MPSIFTSFHNNICDADLADIQLTRNSFQRQQKSIPFKDNKRTTITNGF